MKRMKKMFSVLMIVSALGLVLTACGGDGGTSNTGTVVGSGE